MTTRRPTTGQRVVVDQVTTGRSAGRDFSMDTTIGMPTATPELIATGLAQIEAQRAAEAPSGTLDLPASDQVAPADDFAPGTVIGHFVIRARLGEGGMGMVFAGHDADLGRPVAIKVVKTTAAENPAYRARLLREAQVMARLEHPNVVRVYEIGSDRGRLFVAMELVDGVTLTTWLKVERRRWRDIVAVFDQVGRGLAAVHRGGLVHRDFKPDNVLVDRDGRARVADFGLVRIDPERASLTPELAASLTRTGMQVGTPAYMAPEQHFGGNVDARADQYSFCIALREALIGSRPQKLEDAHWGDVPRPLRAVIARGASVDAAARWPSMEALLEAIERSASRRTKVIAMSAIGVALIGGVAVTVAMAARSSTTDAPAASPPSIAQSPAPSPAPSPPAPEPSAPPITIAAAPKPDGAKPVTRTATPPPTDAPKSTTATDTLVSEMTPLGATEAARQHNVQGDKPPAHEMVAAHRGAVREAVGDIGYGGVTFEGNDRVADIKELEDKIAATTDDLVKGTYLYGIGQAERSQGDCTSAAKHWTDARKLVLSTTQGPITDEKRRTAAFRFYGRIRVAEGICALLNGRALASLELLDNGVPNLFGVPELERAEAFFAEGIARWETGDVERGKSLLGLAAQHGSTDKLRAAIAKYTVTVGP